MDALPTTDPVEAALTGPALTCDACGHALDRHDAIGLRFCAATVRGAMNRKCICAGVTSGAGELANY